jgi:RNA polymerase-binding transcription factor DksA
MMDQGFVERMADSLRGLRSGIVSNLANTDKDFKEIAGGIDPKDAADSAADAIDQKNLAALSAQELSRLKLINAALARVAENRYGICVKCGREIPQARLEAIPYATMCVECKSREERRFS